MPAFSLSHNDAFESIQELCRNHCIRDPVWFRNRMRNTLKFYPFIILLQTETLVTIFKHS